MYLLNCKVIRRMTYIVKYFQYNRIRHILLNRSKTRINVTARTS